MKFDMSCSELYWQIAQGKKVKVANGRESVVETEGRLRFAKFNVDGTEFEARVIGTRMWVVDRAGNGIADFNHGELTGANPNFRFLFA
jgi:hypothetical protein